LLQIIFNIDIYFIMKKTIGALLTLIGLVGTIMFGIQAAQDSESFSVLGLDIAVSSANWTPLIISGVILLVGLVILLRK